MPRRYWFLWRMPLLSSSALRDRSQIGLIDYLLTCVGSSLAVLSAGQAIGIPAVGQYAAGFILFGSAVSYLLRSLGKGSSLVTVDGILYAGAVMIAVIMVPRLNAMMPQGGFASSMMLASGLTWMLILGSFCMWRDGTLLFQAIPAIALFGLVGCYDTFRNVTFAFFAFLICLATLFSRTHTREMLQTANRSGFFARSGQNASGSRTLMAQYDQMREGPWRWLAGPEWALASALVVVFVSLLGAPIIQISAQQFASTARPLQAPPKPGSTPSVIGNQNNTETRIGQGVLLNSNPMYEVMMDSPRYLRSATYDIYTGDGWRSSLEGQLREATTVNWPDVAARRTIANSKTITFAVKCLTSSTSIPVPGEILDFNQSAIVRQRADGTLFADSPLGTRAVRGSAVVAPDTTPRDAVKELPTTMISCLDIAGIDSEVKDLARSVASRGATDYEKARLIKAEIEKRCAYNVRAKGAPASTDTVKYFLFDKKEGYCDSFASAMVVMARSVGVPARYVTGFLPNENNQEGSGRYVVLQKDAHAWAELFFKGSGWVVFDATEGAAVVPGGSDDDAAKVPWYKTSEFTLFANILLGLGAIGGLFVLARIGSPKREIGQTQAELESLYLKFSNLLQTRSKRRRDPSLTPDEFLSLAVSSLSSSAEAARNLNSQFVRLMYGPLSPQPEDIARIRSDLRELSVLLRSEPRKS